MGAVVLSHGMERRNKGEKKHSTKQHNDMEKYGIVLKH